MKNFAKHGQKIDKCPAKNLDNVKILKLQYNCKVLKVNLESMFRNKSIKYKIKECFLHTSVTMDGVTGRSEESADPPDF